LGKEAEFAVFGGLFYLGLSSSTITNHTNARAAARLPYSNQPPSHDNANRTQSWAISFYTFSKTLPSIIICEADAQAAFLRLFRSSDIPLKIF